MALPILGIVGASGQQGSAVLHHILQHHSDKCALRAIVRNPSKYSPPSPSVEVVKGDYASKDTLMPALEGVSFLFAYTNLDMTFDGLEAQWGRNIGDAVRATPSVRLLIFSGAPDAPSISDGTLRCYNYGTKATAEKYIAGIGIPGVVFVWPGFFMQNFGSYQKPVTETEGDGMEPVTVFEAPVREDVLLPFVDIETDLGRLVAAILEQPGKYVGRSVKLAGEWLTYPSLAKQWSKVTGKKSKFRRLSYEKCREAFPLVGEDFVEMLLDAYKYVNWFGYYGGECEEDLEDLQIKATSWEDFVGRTWPSSLPSPPQVYETLATRALGAYYNHFSPSNNGPIEELLALFDDNAVVEFPYAPSDRPSRVCGLSAIKEYFGDWRLVFEFHRWYNESIHPLVNKPGEEGRSTAFGEIECEGVIKTTGQPWRQKYGGVCEVGEDGKILVYREYWDPTPIDAIGDWKKEEKEV